MIQRITFILTILALLAGVTVVKAQDKTMMRDSSKKPMTDMEGKSMEGKKMMESEGMKMGAMKSYSCDSSCGFMVKGPDDEEMSEMVAKHMEKHHDMKMDKKKAKGMLKPMQKRNR